MIATQPPSPPVIVTLIQGIFIIGVAPVEAGDAASALTLSIDASTTPPQMNAFLASALNPPTPPFDFVMFITSQFAVM